MSFTIPTETLDALESEGRTLLYLKPAVIKELVTAYRDKLQRAAKAQLLENLHDAVVRSMSIVQRRATVAEAERDQYRATASRLASRLQYLVTSDCVEDDDLISLQRELEIPEVAALLTESEHG